MTIWLVAILLITYLAAPFVEFRLWRAGKLSDRAATVLLLARLPLLLAAVRERGRELRSTRS
jgi:hypothetical protein